MKSSTASRLGDPQPAFFDGISNPFWNDYPAVERDLARVAQVVRDSVQSASPRLRDALSELVSRRGKMLRPAFVVLAARLRRSGSRGLFRTGGRAFGPTRELPDKIYRMAAAVEILHLATLVHDDIVDDADERRGGAALHRLYGSRDAALMGDYLFSTCFSLVAGYGTMENAQVIASGVSRICEAEIVEAEASGPDEVSLRAYLRRIAGKTALLFALSFHVGASEHDVGAADLRRLRRMGYDIGMGFQIIDDILDLTGDRNRLGKPAGNDLKQGILTAPVILALDRDEDRKLWWMLAADSPDVTAVVAAVEDRGGLTRARTLARVYTERALREAEYLPEGEVRDTLVSTARRLLERDY
ncbi:MAG: polyprenyl synthetase family protein [Spirochaetes bacterium]|nr:polyprenyl synthetase family protein [Spirochaetota bacterium]